MIEHMFCSVASTWPGISLAVGSKIVETPRNRRVRSGVYTRMKRINASVVVATLRTGLTVAAVLILILVLLPAVLAAQAAGIR
jgi:hypothetical protein